MGVSSAGLAEFPREGTRLPARSRAELGNCMARGWDCSTGSPTLLLGYSIAVRPAFNSHQQTQVAPVLLYVLQQRLSQGNCINKAKDKRDKTYGKLNETGAA